MLHFRRAFLAIAISAIPTLAAAAQQAPDTTITLGVTLDRPDWTYATGDSAHFTVTLTRFGKPISGAKVVAMRGPVRMPGARFDTLDLSKGSVQVAATSARPDFIRLTATYRAGATPPVIAEATAGFSPETFRSPMEVPPDFLEFWNKAIADARRLPLDAKFRKLDKWTTPDVDVFEINFQNNRPGSRMYGILSMPSKPGKYPALLIVPGAGVRPYGPSLSLSRRGVIVLSIGIHGISVDRDSSLYDDLRNGPLDAYWRINLDNRDEYYYKRVYVGTVRSGDFLFSLPQFDGTNYVVRGGSQGGALTLVAAALDSRVKAIAVYHPAMSDQLGYRQARAGGWPHTFQDTTKLTALAEKLKTVTYYDGINFAKLVKVPGIYTWGYNDNTVPPSSSWAVYNTISAPKEKWIYPETAHVTIPPQNQRVEAWILDKLGVTKSP